MELPGGYRDARVNRRGECRLSNQAGFDPNVGDTGEWRRTEVSPARRGPGQRRPAAGPPPPDAADSSTAPGIDRGDVPMEDKGD
ncbi:MAG: hypothetical protein ACNA8S_16700, partial [Deferrisomatales bacterium]